MLNTSSFYSCIERILLGEVLIPVLKLVTPCDLPSKLLVSIHYIVFSIYVFTYRVEGSGKYVIVFYNNIFILSQFCCLLFRNLNEKSRLNCNSHAEVKPFCTAYQKIVLIPRPDYASRYCKWLADMLLQTSRCDGVCCSKKDQYFDTFIFFSFCQDS